MTIRLQSLNVMGNTALTTNKLVQKMIGGLRKIRVSNNNQLHYRQSNTHPSLEVVVEI
jgi:hypothetical protein